MLLTFLQDRSDEFDYSKPLEGQKEVAFDDHWRKHSMSFEMDGKVNYNTLSFKTI